MADFQTFYFKSLLMFFHRKYTYLHTAAIQLAAGEHLSQCSSSSLSVFCISAMHLEIIFMYTKMDCNYLLPFGGGG